MLYLVEKYETKRYERLREVNKEVNLAINGISSLDCYVNQLFIANAYVLILLIAGYP